MMTLDTLTPDKKRKKEEKKIEANSRRQSLLQQNAHASCKR